MKSLGFVSLYRGKIYGFETKEEADFFDKLTQDVGGAETSEDIILRGKEFLAAAFACDGIDFLLEFPSVDATPQERELVKEAKKYLLALEIRKKQEELDALKAASQNL